MPSPLTASGRRFFVPALTVGLLLTALCLLPPTARPPVRHLGDFASHTLYVSFIALAALLMLWRGWRGPSRRVLWWPVAVGLSSFLVVEGLKRLTRLPRPDGDPTGFPSGHTTFSFALAWLLTQIHPRLAFLWYAVALMVGWSRVQGYAHFPYQVLCGAALGTLLGVLISRCTQKNVM